MIAKGFKDIRFQNFDGMLSAVINKSSTQKAAHETLTQNTASQNSAIQNGLSMVTKIQNAAKSAFGKNKTKLREFKIGTDKSKSVSKLSQLLDYLAGVCTKYHSDLIENGLTEEDFAAISATYANLVTADTVQEHSKKLRNVATETRDDAVAALQEEMFKIRSFAKSAFAGNKALLEEFKPIKKGGRRGGGTSPTPPPATEPPQK
jgi:prophage DNA circulation protein